jgi:hypothetical protein
MRLYEGDPLKANIGSVRFVVLREYWRTRRILLLQHPKDVILTAVLRVAAASLVVLIDAGLVAETLRLRTRIDQSEMHRAAERESALTARADRCGARPQSATSITTGSRANRPRQAASTAKSTSGTISLILSPRLCVESMTFRRLVMELESLINTIRTPRFHNVLEQEL